MFGLFNKNKKQKKSEPEFLQINQATARIAEKLGIDNKKYWIRFFYRFPMIRKKFIWVWGTKRVEWKEVDWDKIPSVGKLQLHLRKAYGHGVRLLDRKTGKRIGEKTLLSEL